MGTRTATRLHIAAASVAVTSNTPAVTDWCSRYVTPWWHAVSVSSESVGAEPTLLADVDPDQYAKMADLVRSRPHEQTTYARTQILVATDGEDTIAVSEGLAYRSEPGTDSLIITGHEAEPVALAAARLSREMVRGQLLQDGWVVLHASAVTDDKGRTLLAFGSKGSGKTTTALLLASEGWHLLANDRVFARPGPDGVQILPWPSAAAVGLGLLDALGWYDLTRTRLVAGEQLHPTQSSQVTEALLAGTRAPLWERDGGERELKAQIFPHQFNDWFGLNLSTGGAAAALLFPRISPGATPVLEEKSRGLTGEDFMSGATEDRYPDIFGLGRGIDGGGRSEQRVAVTEQLAELPHHSIVLGHDGAENAAFLAELTSEM
ncbi:hypothetical protein OG339_39245 [Streptosporangium sp. NBC_01495]|uniref:hypothetical protein n=1 Tax=Streptosporangium sp. NBC_01495 TaxID=2903899 RepID=UPI002E30B2BC|nr:hypothetical protein [Streptosporangium sp. NBC_01495]